jgi:hypothetical protein
MKHPGHTYGGFVPSASERGMTSRGNGGGCVEQQERRQRSPRHPDVSEVEKVLQAVAFSTAAVL